MHSTRDATTFSKLKVQFLNIGYYYPSTEKIRRSTQFGAVGYMITLYSSKGYVKSWGSVQILGRSGPPTPSAFHSAVGLSTKQHPWVFSFIPEAFEYG